MVQSSHSVSVHGGVEDHVQQPHRLKGLPERLSRMSWRLAKIRGHLPQFCGALRVILRFRFRFAADGEAFGEVHHALKGYSHRIQKRVFFIVLGGATLFLNVGEDSCETFFQQPGVIRHDMTENRAWAYSQFPGFGAFGLSGIFRETPFSVQPGIFQRH